MYAGSPTRLVAGSFPQTQSSAGLGEVDPATYSLTCGRSTCAILRLLVDGGLAIHNAAGWAAVAKFFEKFRIGELLQDAFAHLVVHVARLEDGGVTLSEAE